MLCKGLPCRESAARRAQPVTRPAEQHWHAAQACAAAAHLQVLRLLLQHGLEGLARTLRVAQRTQHAAWPQMHKQVRNRKGLGYP